MPESGLLDDAGKPLPFIDKVVSQSGIGIHSTLE